MAVSFTPKERHGIVNALREAARKNAASVGMRKTTVDELAEEAGISKGAFYKFYQSKEHLFLDMLEQWYQQIYEGTAQAAGHGGVRAVDDAALALAACTGLAAAGDGAAGKGLQLHVQQLYRALPGLGRCAFAHGQVLAQPLGIDRFALQRRAVLAPCLGHSVQKRILLAPGTAHGGAYAHFKTQHLPLRPCGGKGSEAVAPVAAARAQPQSLCRQRIGHSDLGSHGLCVQRGVGQQALALVQIAKRLRGVLTKGRAQQTMQGVAQVGALAGVACMVASHPGG